MLKTAEAATQVGARWYSLRPDELSKACKPWGGRSTGNCTFYDRNAASQRCHRGKPAPFTETHSVSAALAPAVQGQAGLFDRVTWVFPGELGGFQGTSRHSMDCLPE